MTITYSGGMEPDTIQIQYDISGDGLRDHTRQELKRYALVKETDSVYICLYNEQLLAKLKAMNQKHGGRIRMKIRTPAYPVEQAKDVVSEYEQLFREQFKELDVTLDNIELELAGERIKPATKERRRGKKLIPAEDARPYKADEIAAQIRHANSILEDLQESLNARKRYNLTRFKQKDQQQKLFESYERRIRHERGFLETLRQSCAKRAIREGGQELLEVRNKK